jgi:hypothetical protein
MSIYKVHYLYIWEVSANSSSENHFSNNLTRKEKNDKEYLLVNSQKSLLNLWTLFEY